MNKLLLVLFALASICPAQETALDRYVAKPDPVYGWKLIRTLEEKGMKAHVLELTSQTWRTSADVDQPVWKHWLTIVAPQRVSSTKALLVIGGGSNRDPAPSKIPARAAYRIGNELRGG